MGRADRQRQTSVEIVMKALERERDVELTDDANSSKDVENVGDCEFRVKRRTHVEEITRVEGMGSRLARIKRRRAGPEEQAESWEKAEETHEAGKERSW
jgi:hypothetical protein